MALLLTEGVVLGTEELIAGGSEAGLIGAESGGELLATESEASETMGQRLARWFKPTPTKLLIGGTGVAVVTHPKIIGRASNVVDNVTSTLSNVSSDLETLSDPKSEDNIFNLFKKSENIFIFGGIALFLFMIMRR